MQYDPFQTEAIAHVNQGHSVIVSAPTGSGKTVIAEHVIDDCLRRGRKVIYTAPIKALSNQKYRDFQKIFPGQIGILTGDVTINPHAAGLIMTTEIFRNKIVAGEQSLRDYDWIIFDEIHYLDDFERGTVWEESLIFMPDHMKVLGLSATVPNVDELAGWFESIHRRPLRIVTETKRPVPLHVAYQCQDMLYDDMNKLVKKGFRTPEIPKLKGRKIPRHAYVKPNRLPSLIHHLAGEDLLPCIYFVFSRRRTEYLADEVRRFSFLDESERSEIMEMFERLCEHFDLSHEPSAHEIRPFIERGIAYHHAGMLPTLKEVVERLFTSRLIKMIFTTETFALGINMPARTVIFDELRKFYGTGHANLKTRDFYQMAGRAGRRSIDKEGFVFCRINPHFMAPHELRRIIFGRNEPVYSRFNASYATLINLYQTYGEKLYDIYPRSFHYYQENKRSRRRALEMMYARVKILKDMGFIRKNQVTAKGLFAGNVYGYELLLAELYEQGRLDQLSLYELGVLITALVYEPRKNAVKPRLSPAAVRLERVTDKLYQTIHRHERKARIKPYTPRGHFHLSGAIDIWIKGKSFSEVLKETEVDEGEVIRYFRMTVQVLREIADAPVSEGLRDRAWQLIGLINRDIVDSEKQLRE